VYSSPPATATDGGIILFDCFRPEGDFQREEGGSLEGIHPEDVVGDSLGVRAHQDPVEDSPGEGGHAVGIPEVGDPPVAGSPGLAVVRHAAGDTLGVEQVHPDLAAVGLVAVELLAAVTSQRAVGGYCPGGGPRPPCCCGGGPPRGTGPLEFKFCCEGYCCGGRCWGGICPFGGGCCRPGGTPFGGAALKLPCRAGGLGLGGG